MLNKLKLKVPVSKKTILLIVSIFCICINATYLLYKEFFARPEIVYVDNLQLFDGFNMTKELKKVGERQFTSQKQRIDSLYSQIQKSSPKEQQILMKEYIGLKENLEQFNQQFAVQESGKIWERLQTYIEEFSAKKNYKLILGSNNKQDVLYANPEVNITNELINYVNSKYEGIQ